MKKTKLMFIINNLGLGGAEKFFVLLLKELAKRKDLAITVVSLEGKGELTTVIKNLPLDYKEFHYHLFPKFFGRFDPYFRFRLFFYALGKKPDLIHGQLMKGEDFAKVLGGLLGVPVITTLHDVMIKPGKKQRFLNRFLTKGVAVSAAAAKHLEEAYRLPKEKILVIPDAIEPKDFEAGKKKFDPKNPVFIYIGRIFSHKGLEFAIKGLAKLKKEIPNLSFLIFGDASFEKNYFKNLKNLVEKNHWDFVCFKGKTDNVPNALSQGDIFVLPSKNEGFSLAVLEAATAEKPIIATKTGSIPEMIDEGKSGYFVSYGSEEEIYEAAKKILAGNVSAFGQHSGELVKDKFSIEKVADLYYNLYLESLN